MLLAFAVASTVGMAGCGSVTGERKPVGPPAGVHPALTAPAGERVVTFRGLALDVPASWPTVTAGCGATDHAAVIFGGNLRFGCPSQHGPTRPDRFDTVVLSGPRPGSSPGRPTTVAGLAATRSETATDGRTRVDVDIPSTGAELIFDVADPRTADRILATARQIEADTLGCPTLPPSDAPTVSGGPGDGRPVVSPTPTAGAVCTYEGGRLEQSAPVTGKDLGLLVAAVNRTAGHPSTLDRAPMPDCRTQEQVMPPPWSLLRLTSSQGLQLVTVTVSACPRGGPGVAGRTQGAVTFELFDDLSTLTRSLNEMPGNSPNGCTTAACRVSGAEVTYS